MSTKRIPIPSCCCLTCPNLVYNGSFELPVVPAGTLGWVATIPGWSTSVRPLKAGETQAANGNGHLDVVKLLVEAGAKVNAKYGGGKTPLAEAKEMKHDDVANFLAENGGK